MAEKFYITTPIYTPNAEPHLGHVYHDALRTHWLAITDWRAMTRFRSPTDEHGIKMVKTAQDL